MLKMSDESHTIEESWIVMTSSEPQQIHDTLIKINEAIKLSKKVKQMVDNEPQYFQPYYLHIFLVFPYLLLVFKCQYSLLLLEYDY